LIGDVRPGSGCAQRFQSIPQSLSHGYDSVGHSLDAFAPLSVERGIGQNGVHDARAVSWRVGIPEEKKLITIKDELFVLNYVAKTFLIF